jgi:hypothetical protein
MRQEKKTKYTPLIRRATKKLVKLSGTAVRTQLAINIGFKSRESFYPYICARVVNVPGEIYNISFV